MLSADEILDVFRARPGKALGLSDLTQALKLKSSEVRLLKAGIKALSKAHEIRGVKNSRFILESELAERGAQRHAAAVAKTHAAPTPPPHPRERVPPTIIGRLIGHRDGYGFVVPDAPAGGADIFIPPHAMKDAMHGDRVEVYGIREKAENRPGARGSHPPRVEGSILRVIRHEQKTVVGEFHHGARYNYVQPFDSHISYEIVIPRGRERPATDASVVNRQFGAERATRRAPDQKRAERELDGMIVDVEVESFPGRGAAPSGRVIEVLGARDDFGVDVEMMIRKYHLPHRFPADALTEAGAAPTAVTADDLAGRDDFRSLPVVTIDGETAKDFDDAVYVERLPNGHYLLQVHIADVAHYVRSGSAIDAEARLRGTSVYFPGRAVPMLPLELSNGICSLNPLADRLVMTALLEIDKQGATANCRLTPGVIRSHQRMTYTAVHAILTSDDGTRSAFAPLVAGFELMAELARLLTARRSARGSIDFDLPAAEVEFDAEGRMAGIRRSERNIAHRIIEEFMLAANEAVAEYLERSGVPALYRIHEKPDVKRVIEFEEVAATFGYSLGMELPAARRVRVRGRDRRSSPQVEELAAGEDLKITSRHYQRLAARIAGKPEERILSYLMLRSLKQARYSESNAGHFALASSAYTHFTSPIRRYPDLVVHRAVKSALAASGHRRRGLEGGEIFREEDLRPLARETSECERRAEDAERELIEWKKMNFMASRVGDEFEALLISLTRHGVYVELTDLFVEGFIPAETLPGWGWTYREKLRAFVSRDGRRTYRLGDRLRVRLDRADRDRGKLLFSIADA